MRVRRRAFALQSVHHVPNMSRCIAFVASRADENGWSRCVRKGADGDELCAQHRNAARGILLGLDNLATMEALQEVREKHKRRRDARLREDNQRSILPN